MQVGCIGLSLRLFTDFLQFTFIVYNIFTLYLIKYFILSDFPLYDIYLVHVMLFNLLTLYRKYQNSVAETQDNNRIKISG